MLVTLGLVLVAARTAGRTDFWAALFPQDPEELQAESDASVVTHTALRPERSPVTGPSPARVLPDHLRSSIEDNVIGVSSDESRAWFVTLDLAERLTPAQTRRLPEARYALLMDAAEDCRGRAWTVTGTLRRMTREQLTNDSTKYREVVDAWVTLPDSGDGLVHVVALEAGRDLPFAAEYDQRTRLKSRCPDTFSSGKPMHPGAEGGISIAPLLLASSITRVPLNRS